MLIQDFIILILLAVPEDPPSSVRVVGNDPSSVLVSWVPPSVPNGVITHYTLYIDYNDRSPVTVVQSSAPSTSYVVTGLQPHQLISVTISASTIVGEGPMSDTYRGRAREQGDHKSMSIML